MVASEAMWSSPRSLINPVEARSAWATSTRAPRAIDVTACRASTAFTVEGKHILQVREEFRPYVDSRDGTPPSLPYFIAAAEGSGPYYFSDWPRHFDYVFILFTNPGDPDPVPARLRLIEQGRHFQLYRVIPPS